VCECVLGSPGASQPLNTRLCLSSTLAFSLCLMPLTLAVGAITPFSGPSAPPPPFLTATQRVHPPHLPSSPGPPLCTSNMTTLLTTNLTNKTKENKRPKNPISMLPTESRVGHLATSRTRRLHAYMSHGYVPGPCNVCVFITAVPITKLFVQVPLFPPLLRDKRVFSTTSAIFSRAVGRAGGPERDLEIDGSQRNTRRLWRHLFLCREK